MLMSTTHRSVVLSLSRSAPYLAAGSVGIQSRRTFSALLVLLTTALCLAPPANGAVRDGQTFGDWAAHCEVPRGEKKEHCFIFQNVAMQPSGKRLVHFAAGYLTQDEHPSAIVTLPLGISLPPGLGLRIDGKEMAHFPVERCDTTGCFGALALMDELLVALKSGRMLRVHFMDAGRNEITAPISLEGFEQGFDALR